MKYIIVIPCILLSCVPKSSQEVKVAGNLRRMMMDNATESNIELTVLQSYTHLYALGAIEDLEGEVTVVDGVPFITKVDGDTIVSSSTFDVKATLLVYSQVERFRTIDVNEDMDLQSLESFLGQVAEERELGSSFAFRVKGAASKIDWHVINGPSKDHDHTSSAYTQNDVETEIELLGFYSDSSQGVFTHHGSNTHIHLVDPNKGMTAHVDDVIVKANSKLLIPARP